LYIKYNKFETADRSWTSVKALSSCKLKTIEISHFEVYSDISAKFYLCEILSSTSQNIYNFM